MLHWQNPLKNLILVHFLTVHNTVVKKLKKVVKKINDLIRLDKHPESLTETKLSGSCTLVNFQRFFLKNTLKKSGLVYFMRRLFEARIIYSTTAVNSSSVNFTEISK